MVLNLIPKILVRTFNSTIEQEILIAGQRHRLQSACAVGTSEDNIVAVGVGCIGTKDQGPGQMMTDHSLDEEDELAH